MTLIVVSIILVVVIRVANRRINNLYMLKVAKLEVEEINYYTRI